MESKKRRKKKVSKLLKNHFKSINFFFQIFRDYRGGVGGSDQIWKIPDFFFFWTLPWDNRFYYFSFQKVLLCFCCLCINFYTRIGFWLFCFRISLNFNPLYNRQVQNFYLRNWLCCLSLTKNFHTKKTCQNF